MSTTIETAFTGPGPSRIYHEYLESGDFRIQCCDDCGKYIFYPRITCTHCGSTQLQWVPAVGRGTVYAVSVVNRQEEKGGPYNVVLVDLAEGPRMMARVDGVSNDQIKIGMSVKTRIESSDKGPFVVFESAEEDKKKS
ncbi:Zn-ribbon domain-containing OB-fold protein [Polaromonas sp. AET17H-212]|uniref:Zn-ribbon domain-containing OB-fold protein n=1 Tax=Polaromonas sp. AET17H-212 TaxID=1977061 RepID=UPI000BBC5F4D|nr:OB-fold domain-containing protein [Polaromonas sp. AET17H-212]